MSSFEKILTTIFASVQCAQDVNLWKLTLWKSTHLDVCPLAYHVHQNDSANGYAVSL
jgi:hypothetical protein